MVVRSRFDCATGVPRPLRGSGGCISLEAELHCQGCRKGESGWKRRLLVNETSPFRPLGPRVHSPSNPYDKTTVGCRKWTFLCASKLSEEDREFQNVSPPLKVPAKIKGHDNTQKRDDGPYQTYGIFDWSEYATPFAAPWSGRNAALGLLAWGASFVGIGLSFLPVIKLLGGSEGGTALTPQDLALITLANQGMETAAGLAIVRFAANSATKDADSFMNIDFRHPFRKPDGWAAWGLLGVVLSPAVVYAAASICQMIGIQDDPNARGTADAVSQMLQLDSVTFGSLFVTTAILAPVLEETVFRGFLLPSLAKVMPTPAAVAISAVAFGLVHLSPRDTPQLTALGLLLGFSYVRSRNLLTPMMIHGCWNGTVLSILYWLQLQGFDLQKILHGQI